MYFLSSPELEPPSPSLIKAGRYLLLPKPKINKQRVETAGPPAPRHATSHAACSAALALCMLCSNKKIGTGPRGQAQKAKGQRWLLESLKGHVRETHDGSMQQGSAPRVGAYVGVGAPAMAPAETNNSDNSTADSSGMDQGRSFSRDVATFTPDFMRESTCYGLRARVLPATGFAHASKTFTFTTRPTMLKSTPTQAVVNTNC